MGASTATLAWLWSGYIKDTALAKGRPASTEVAWPFAPDEWGECKAFHCKTSACGAEINLYIWAKHGFCTCEAGIADDTDLERMGDLYLVGGQTAALGIGRSIAVGHMTSVDVLTR